MTDNTTNVKNTANTTNTTNTLKKELTYEDKVLQKIVGIALESVHGLLTVDGGFFSNLTSKIVNTDDVTKGIDVEVGKKQVAVDLDVVVEYGKNIPEVFDNIIKEVQAAVQNMTSLQVVEVNVNVVDVKTKAEQEEDEVTLQDKAGEALDSAAESIKKGADKTGKTVKKSVESNRVE